MPIEDTIVENWIKKMDDEFSVMFERADRNSQTGDYWADKLEKFIRSSISLAIALKGKEIRGAIEDEKLRFEKMRDKNGKSIPLETCIYAVESLNNVLDRLTEPKVEDTKK